MSANDLAGEVDKRINFDSPNISSQEDEQQKLDQVEDEMRKKAETVEIDGLPFDEKDLKYKAEDIFKKSKTEYFTNVDGAERRAKEEARRVKRAAEDAEKTRKITARKEAEELEAKRKLEAYDKKQQRKEDERVIGEIKKKVAIRKKENRENRRIERSRKLKAFFLGGWHKFISISTLLAVAIVLVVFVIIPKIDNRIDQSHNEDDDAINRAYQEEISQDLYEQIVDILEEGDDFYSNYDFAAGNLSYERAISKVGDNAEVASRVYYRQSNSLYKYMESEHINDAISTAYKAYELQPKEVTYISWLHVLYTIIGDTKNADKFQEILNIENNSTNNDNDPKKPELGEG